MKKIYPILPNIEITNKGREDDIIDMSVPDWIYNEMKKVAEREKCNIRDLIYKREIVFIKEDGNWQDRNTIELTLN
jgi:hypothetical protein